MEKLFYFLVYVTLTTTTMVAQYTNPSASGDVNVEVARNASVEVFSYTAPLGAGSTSEILGGTLTATVWLVKNQTKSINVVFKITGEPGANIKVSTSISSTVGGGNVEVMSQTHKLYKDAVLGAPIFTNIVAGLDDNTSFNGVPDHLTVTPAELWATIDSTVKGVTPSQSTTLEYTCALSNYSM